MVTDWSDLLRRVVSGAAGSTHPDPKMLAAVEKLTKLALKGEKTVVFTQRRATALLLQKLLRTELASRTADFSRRSDYWRRQTSRLGSFLGLRISADASSPRFSRTARRAGAVEPTRDSPLVGKAPSACIFVRRRPSARIFVRRREPAGTRGRSGARPPVKTSRSIRHRQRSRGRASDPEVQFAIGAADIDCNPKRARRDRSPPVLPTRRPL